MIALQRWWKRGVLAFLGLAIASSVLSLNGPPRLMAAPQPQTLRVATRLIPPFVMEEGGKLTGFSIELWQKIADQMGVRSTLTPYPTLPKMFAAVEQQNADLAIAAISITAEREQKFDFSYPIFASGLKIMVRNPNRSGFVPNLLRDLLSPALLQIIGLALAMIVIAAHLIWLFERRHPHSSISEKYFPGIFEAAWWAASTLATQAEEMPRGALGRVMAIFWMFISVLFVAYFTATVTAGMTVQNLQGDIKSVEDLKGRAVATTANSTAAAFLQGRQLQVLEVDKIEAAYAALANKQVDAVLFDAPVLMYYAARDGQGKVQLVGETVRDENYGILLPINSPYRKEINRALLKLKEDGTSEALHDKWFNPER
ncbi:transporter substrate-binding domain-containing protein [Altericista sp. CCNU0014]|uniref:transporter substrate-binding domain-containing protein n=1 Tax=Altericista sp. CCNU0014 TaxID=3082949 RepID=UPI00384A6BF7